MVAMPLCKTGRLEVKGGTLIAVCLSAIEFPKSALHSHGVPKSLTGFQEETA